MTRENPATIAQNHWAMRRYRPFCLWRSERPCGRQHCPMTQCEAVLMPEQSRSRMARGACPAFGENPGAPARAGQHDRFRPLWVAIPGDRSSATTRSWVAST